MKAAGRCCVSSPVSSQPRQPCCSERQRLDAFSFPARINYFLSGKLLELRAKYADRLTDIRIAPFLTHFDTLTSWTVFGGRGHSEGTR